MTETHFYIELTIIEHIEGWFFAPIYHPIYVHPDL